MTGFIKPKGSNEFPSQTAENKPSRHNIWTFQKNSKFLLDNLANDSDETINYTAYDIA